VTSFGLVSRGEFIKPGGATDEALRFGAIVFVAPVTLFFETRNQGRIAPRTLSFRNAMLGAPPASMAVVDNGFGAVFAVIVNGATSVTATATAHGERCRSKHSHQQNL